MKEISYRVIIGAAGFIFGMLITFALIKPSMDRLAVQAQQTHDECAKLQDENAKLRGESNQIVIAAQAIAKQNAELRQRNTEAFSEATVLYEPVPQNGAITILSSLMGHPLPVVAGMQPRWFIPAKVKPIVYGDPHGMQLIYIDGDGRKEGPFAPEILPQ